MNEQERLFVLMTDAVEMIHLTNKYQIPDSDMNGITGLSVAMFDLLVDAVLSLQIRHAGDVLLNGLHAAYALGYERGSHQDPVTKAGTELLKSLGGDNHA